MLTALLLALGLSMDAVAVSICAGLSRPGEPFWRALRMPLAFGFFQALMPLLGWLGGKTVVAYVADWDHWIAFALLAAIGGKMLWEAWKGDDECPAGDPFAWGRLSVLAIATSIDALAAGLTIAFIQQPPLLTIAVIGCTTALLCLPAVRLGGRLGERWAGRAEIVGGLVLIGIGAKIVVDHLTA
ncbi:MAG: manganese efflux pump [Planctomycetes bacterium]|nr:manganese efflux pump [Planctomycetota bacterium]